MTGGSAWVVAGLGFFLVACGAASTSPSPGVTPSGPAASVTPAPSGMQAACQTLTGGGSGSARITDMQVSTATSGDTLTMWFDAAVPQYEISANPTGMQFMSGGGKGGTVMLDGSEGVTLRITHLLWTEPPGNQFPHGTDLKQPNGMLLEARQIENSEGVVVIGMGLAHSMCPSVTMLSNPSRLVLQFMM